MVVKTGGRQYQHEDTKSFAENRGKKEKMSNCVGRVVRGDVQGRNGPMKVKTSVGEN